MRKRKKVNFIGTTSGEKLAWPVNGQAVSVNQFAS